MMVLEKILSRYIMRKTFKKMLLSNKIVIRYVISNTFWAMLGAVFLLSGLQILFTYLGELGELKEHYTAWNALQYVFWKSPEYIHQIIPISALIGAVVGLGSMASNSELVVMRASGMSLWNIVSWVMRPALILIVFSFALTEWVMPYSSEQAKHIKYPQSTASLGEVRGYWTREGQNFIYIDYANAKGELRQVQQLQLDENYHLQSWLQAKSGQFVRDGEWKLTDVQQTQRLEQQHSQFFKSTEQAFPLALQPQYVHMVTVDAEDLSPSQLIRLMRYMNEHNQVPKTYQLAFWQKVASPFALMALVVIACSFIFGPLRQQSMGFRLVIALFTGLGFYYLQDFLGYASLVYSPSPFWFVSLPIVLMFAIGFYLLHRAR